MNAMTQRLRPEVEACHAADPRRYEYRSGSSSLETGIRSLIRRRTDFGLRFFEMVDSAGKIPVSVASDLEASRPLDTLPKLPHCRVGRLDVTAKPIRVEQWETQSIVLESVAKPAKQ
jgi:hypothetical protein